MSDGTREEGGRGRAAPRASRRARTAEERQGAGVHWGSPQILLPLLALLAAGLYAVRSEPPRSSPAPELAVPSTTDAEVPRTEAVVYVVDESGLAHPSVVEIAAREEPSARLQEIVDALRAEMTTSGVWPGDLPAPHVHAFTLERREVAVLDLPAAPVRLDVSRERAILASLDRTLAEAGIDDVAYLRDGAAEPAWLGNLVTPSGFD